MGLFPNAFAPTAITDQRVVVPVPAGWSFAQAASVPVAFLTAYIALVQVAGVRAGQRVLIHAGAGGWVRPRSSSLGIWVRRCSLPLTPASTTSCPGWGWTAEHIGSSRTLDFVEAFDRATAGQGMDVVLNSLTGDSSMPRCGLLARGGCFIEIGKTDIRDREQIDAAHPGVGYHTYRPGRHARRELGRRGRR